MPREPKAEGTRAHVGAKRGSEHRVGVLVEEWGGAWDCLCTASCLRTLHPPHQCLDHSPDHLSP